MNQEENPPKSYKKNDLIAVLKKDDKKDPIYLFQVSLSFNFLSHQYLF